MKRIFLLMLSAGTFSMATHTANAQEDKVKDTKKEEIVIRKNGDKDAKVTIEMKDDEVLINGKPLSEFNDSNITVMKRKEFIRHGNNMLIKPRGGNSFYFNDNDGETRPFLGVTTEKDDNGVKITDVVKGSAAEKAGLKEDDIITKIGNKKITGPDNLMDAVKSYKPKDEIKIYYQRNGKANDTKATLGERKESKIRAFSFNRDGIPMDADMKDFKFEMPPMPPTPKQPFYNFWMPSNKKLGVKIEDTDNDSGTKITKVEEGSAAEKAGLKKDDIITEVDGEKVKNTGEVKEQVLQNEKSNYIIKAKRGTTEMSFEIKIPKKINSADL